jgi:hypothetical protein
MADLVSDRDEIRDLLARYNYHGDRGRIEELAACFAADGLLEYPGAEARGPAEIAAALTSGPRNTAITFVRHHITNPHIAVTADAATARSYFTVYANAGPDHAGTYDDRLIRTPSGWRFAHRRVRIDWQAPGSLFRPMATAR